MIRYVLIAILLAGCAQRPVYAPRMQCPPLPLLPNPATDAQKVEWMTRVTEMYNECALSRRTCKYPTIKEAQ